MAAYNGMKERKLVLEGVGLENRIGEKLKLRLVRKLTDSSYSMMVAAINGLKQFLRLQRDLEDLYRLEFERQQREKQRCLIRIMDSNLNLAAVAFRQSYQWMQSSLTSERTVLYKHRGIMRRILDSNTRLLAQGYNKLLEEAKSRKSTLKHKLKSLVKSFYDKDLRFLTTAYNC
jgi:DnaJ-domain-containing protein 1